MTEAKPKSLAAKLAEIVLAVQRVEKRGHNEFHDYSYATAADVLEAVRTGLASRNVVIIPRVVGQSVISKERQGKAPEYITTADMILTILDGDSGETLECAWKGCGQDAGDKGIYKALTGGYKYFLLQLFMIPTGDDPEKSSKKRHEAPGRASEPPAELDPGSDAAIILKIASELAQLPGETRHPDDIIKAASKFVPKGKTNEVSFTDPRTKNPGAWLKLTREKLEKELHSKGAITAVGDEILPF